MPLPRAKDVPCTAGVSGLVVVLAVFNLGSPLVEVTIFAAWGVMYLLECQVRGLFRRRDREPELDGPTPPARQADSPLDAIGDERT